MVSISKDFRSVFTYNYTGEPGFDKHEIETNNFLKVISIVPGLGIGFTYVVFEDIILNKNYPKDTHARLMVVRAIIAFIPGVNTVVLGSIDIIGTIAKRILDAKENHKTKLVGTSAKLDSKSDYSMRKYYLTNFGRFTNGADGASRMDLEDF